MLENTEFLSCEYLAQYSLQLQNRCKSEPSSGPMSRRWTAFQLRCLITWGQLSSTHWNGWFKNGSLCSLHLDPMSCRRRFTSEPEWQWWERRRATERANQNTVCWWMAPCSQWLLPPPFQGLPIPITDASRCPFMTRRRHTEKERAVLLEPWWRTGSLVLVVNRLFSLGGEPAL